MKLKRIPKPKIFLFPLLILCLIFGCKLKQEQEKHKLDSNLFSSKKLKKNNSNPNFSESDVLNSIPKKVYEIRDYVRENQEQKLGYIGGRKFKNLEKRLPVFTENNLKISYQEWDVNKKTKGKNRGVERLITGTNGVDYYTNDHYKSFKKLKVK